jgi:Ubiquitin carboxyl-terminal hydrolase
LTSGHYFSYVKNKSDGLWYLCNDSVVRKVETSRVFSSQAYILAYRKVSELKLEELKSNISISSFGTKLNRSIMNINTEQDVDLGFGSLLGDP